MAITLKYRELMFLINIIDKLNKIVHNISYGPCYLSYILIKAQLLHVKQNYGDMERWCWGHRYPSSG